MINENDFRLKKDGTPYKQSLCQGPELIENYSAAVTDKTQTWHCHHRLETHTSDGERRTIELTREELKALDMYYNRPAEELIFLTSKEHRRLHHHSEETKRSISKAHKGMCFSEEHKAKLSAAHKGKSATWNIGKCRSEETKQKMSAAFKGKHWKLVDGKRTWY